MSQLFDQAVATLGRLRALAERDPRRAVPLARRCHARWSEPATRALAEYTLGWALLCWERPADARAQLVAALPELVGLPGLRCRYALLLADLLERPSPALEPAFAELAAQLDREGAPADATRARIYQAVLYNILGRAHDAEALLGHLEPALATPADTARWLRVRGAAAMQLGRYAQAAGLIGLAEQRFAELGNRLERAKCQSELAWCALQAEKLDLALQHYRQAGQAFQLLDMPLRAAVCGRGVGALLTRLGDYQGALHYLLAALGQFQQHQRLRDSAACQLQLGNLYYFAGLWEAAFASYTRSAASLQAAGAAGDALTARRNCALVYRAQARYDEAAALLDTLEGQAAGLGNRAELAAIWMEQGAILAARGSVDAGLRRYERARRAFLAADHQLGAADCAIDMGALALARGQVELALNHFQQAKPELTRHPHHRWRADAGLARCAEAQGDSAGAMRHYQAALATVASLRGRLFSEAISSGVYTQAAQLHADALRLAVAEGAIDTALAVAEDQRALVLRRLLAAPATAVPAAFGPRHDALRLEISRLSTMAAHNAAAELDQALAAYGELLLHARHSAPIDRERALPDAAGFELASTRASLSAAYGADWTALCYTQHGDKLLLHMLTPDELLLKQIDAGRALHQLLDRVSLPLFRYHTYRDATHRQTGAWRAWDRPRTLAERLLPAELRARLHPGHRLLIVPGGPLHRLPWAALRLDDAWLAEQAIIQLVPSLSAWQLLSVRRPPAGRRALVVGCGDFGARAPALLAIDQEAALIRARWLGDCDLLLDAQATRAALLDRSARGELRQYQLIHCATHAQLLPRRGLAAHLKLYDDDLLLPEIASLNLGGGLVVLATCDGAAADSLPGEELLSLNWALLAAGAGSVIASLWPISNQAALGVTAALYAALREQPDPAQALAHAQRALLAAEQGQDEATTPIGWGGFVCTGR